MADFVAQAQQAVFTPEVLPDDMIRDKQQWAQKLLMKLVGPNFDVWTNKCDMEVEDGWSNLDEVMKSIVDKEVFKTAFALDKYYPMLEVFLSEGSVQTVEFIPEVPPGSNTENITLLKRMSGDDQELFGDFLSRAKVRYVDGLDSYVKALTPMEKLEGAWAEAEYYKEMKKYLQTKGGPPQAGDKTGFGNVATKRSAGTSFGSGSFSEAISPKRTAARLQGKGSPGKGNGSMQVAPPQSGAGKVTEVPRFQILKAQPLSTTCMTVSEFLKNKPTLGCSLVAKILHCPQKPTRAGSNVKIEIQLGYGDAHVSLTLWSNAALQAAADLHELVGQVVVFENVKWKTFQVTQAFVVEQVGALKGFCVRVIKDPPSEAVQTAASWTQLVDLGALPKYHRVNVQGHIRSVGVPGGTAERKSRQIEFCDFSGNFILVSAWGAIAESEAWEKWNVVQIVHGSMNPDWRSIEVDETSVVDVDGYGDLSDLGLFKPVMWH